MRPRTKGDRGSLITHGLPACRWRTLVHLDLRAECQGTVGPPPWRSWRGSRRWHALAMACGHRKRLCLLLNRPRDSCPAVALVSACAGAGTRSRQPGNEQGESERASECHVPKRGFFFLGRPKWGGGGGGFFFFGGSPPPPPPFSKKTCFVDQSKNRGPHGGANCPQHLLFLLPAANAQPHKGSRQFAPTKVGNRVIDRHQQFIGNAQHGPEHALGLCAAALLASSFCSAVGSPGQGLPCFEALSIRLSERMKPNIVARAWPRRWLGNCSTCSALAASTVVEHRFDAPRVGDDCLRPFFSMILVGPNLSPASHCLEAHLAILPADGVYP